VVVSGRVDGPVIGVPTATTAGAGRSVQETVGGRVATAASAVGSGIARLVHPGGSIGAPAAVAGGIPGVTSLVIPLSRTGWGRSLLPLSALLILGAIVTILAGVMLRRRAVRRAADAVHEFGETGFPDVFAGFLGASAEETSEGYADHTAWGPYAPPPP
jgi:hypothetical protein